LRGCEKLWRL